MWLLVLGCCLLRRDAASTGADDGGDGLPAYLWLGGEGRAPVLPALRLGAADLPVRLPAGDQRPVQVLGLYDAGTNLMQALLLKNFQGQMSPVPADRRFYGLVFWKHAQPALLLEKVPWLQARLRERRVLGVAVVRDPLAWFQSLKDEPYDLAGCVRGPDWLTRPCTLPLASTSGGGQQSTMPGPLTLPGLAEYWNAWTRQYDELEAYGMQKLVVRYEDLVLDTEKEVERVASALGADLQQFRQQQSAAKPSSGGPEGRQKALAKLEGQTWLGRYAPGELEAVCARLDRGLMAKYGYSCP